MATIDTVYICDWLPPDFGATGQYGVHFSRELAAAGRRVVLIGLSSSRSSTEVEDHGGTAAALTIVRIAARPCDKQRLTRRMAWTLAVNTRLLIRAWRYIRRAERVLFTGSPPLFLHWIMPANAVLRKRITYRITDFHPECLIAQRGRATWLDRAALGVTMFWRRRVDEFQVLGHDQIRRLEALGIPRSRLVFKPDPAPIVIGPETRPLPRPAAAGDRAIVLYSGNWGVAHDTATFIEAYARHHREHPRPTLLWLNAVGVRADEVEEALRRLSLPLIRSRPVPLEELASLLVTPDAHLITLSDAFVGYVLPSKVHGCVASGLPTLFIGSTGSDVHEICADALGERYYRADVGDAAAATAALGAIADAAAAAASRLDAHLVRAPSRQRLRSRA